MIRVWPESRGAGKKGTKININFRTSHPFLQIEFRLVALPFNLRCFNSWTCLRSYPITPCQVLLPLLTTVGFHVIGQVDYRVGLRQLPQLRGTAITQLLAMQERRPNADRLSKSFQEKNSYFCLKHTAFWLLVKFFKYTCRRQAWPRGCQFPSCAVNSSTVLEDCRLSPLASL